MVELIAFLKLYTTLLHREAVSTAGVHPGHTQSFNSHTGTMWQISPGALLSRTAQHSHVGATSPALYTAQSSWDDPGDDEGGEVVAAQLPHVKRHILAARLHLYVCLRHWLVAHMPAPVFGGNSLLIFFVHLLAVHLSWQAAVKAVSATWVSSRRSPISLGEGVTT